MIKLGITGGVGSGKSRVLEFLREQGAAVYEADQIGKEIQQPGEECFDQIVATFGKEILDENGFLNRKVLGGIVFADEKKLAKLNSIVHPMVNQKIEEFMRMEEERGTRVFVLESALLHLEVYRKMLDEIWYIYVRERVRRERLRSSRDYTDEKISSIFSSQPAEGIYFAISSRMIDNEGDFEKTKRELTDAYAELLAAKE